MDAPALLLEPPPPPPPLREDRLPDPDRPEGTAGGEMPAASAGLGLKTLSRRSKSAPINAV